ncbi:D-2-hydroxyacid dehydrogenase [Mesorhizobium sp.]|uniref:D-2-hydroxyacid dehydrogenase n=1 Tax=Mesorhizobium sp. TaxID=1871066 RepID=UPI000FE7F43A|nr:D-2-hydroxyacid dehydrogenase [Mesorhizobium sp.]RWO82083.1 MAG: D-2-hydroxyacid dehydrogenase [Mesorhizobium sp.]
MPVSKNKVVVIYADDTSAPPQSLREGDKLATICITSDTEHAKKELQGAGAIFLWNNSIPIALFEPLPSDLEWIHVGGLGVNGVVTPDVVMSDIVVTNTRGILEHPIAEYVLGIMLMIAKDFRKTIESQRLKEWNRRQTASLRGHTVVLIGPGGIGREVFTLLQLNGVKVVPVGRRAVQNDPVFGRIHSVEDLKDLLPVADTVVLSLPLTTETRRMMDESRFSQMKRGACLINVGRGGLVDESALVKALESGQVGNAALDVFTTEPLPKEHPFWCMDQVFVSPHISADVHGCEDLTVASFLENLERWVKGRPLENVVDKAARSG